ncbi:MAG: hypothetical protein K2G35_02410 [Duncaniella sp.]|nr:hypothetical protein [Duncaniella sp.]
MKSFLLTILMAAGAVTALATPPNLAVESVFTRTELRRTGYDITITRQPNNYYRSISAERDPKLLKEVRALFEKDSKRADNYVERYDDGDERHVLNIPHEGRYINVGLSVDSDGSFRLFVQGEPEAFK